jgi:hypothetical protein
VKARVMLAGAAVLALLLPSTASAQVTTSASAMAHAGPNGLKVGEGRLHPFVDLEPRLDTAAGFFPVSGNGPPATSPSAEVVMHLRPGVKFELPSNALAIDFTGAVEYLYYTGVLTPGSYVASRLEGAAGLTATANRQGAVEFQLGDDFSYSDKTRNLSLGIGALSLFNEARAQLNIRPGGGALEISPRGAFGLEQFRPLSLVRATGCPAGSLTCDPNAISQMNYTNFRGGLDARWKFLPKTAIVIESNFDARSYANGTANALLLRAVGGLQGLVTTKVAVVGKVGWGYDFATPVVAGATANTFIGHVELSYLMTEASNFKVGYYRTLEPTPVYQVARDDRIYADARLLLSGRLTLRAYGALDLIGFLGGQDRFDTAVTLDPGAEYQIFPWLYAAAGYTLTTRSSGGTQASGASTDNYTRHEAHVRITAAY